MDAFQSVLVYVSINLGRGNIGMPKHHLHRPQVGTVAKKVGGKGMADHVRRDFLIDSNHQSGCSDYLPKSQAGHTGTAPGNEKKIAALVFENEGPGGIEVVIDFLPGLFAKGDQPFFIALAEYPDKSGTQVACRKRQANQF